MSKLDVTDVEAIKETSAKIAKHIMTILHEIAQQRAPLHNYMYGTIYINTRFYIIITEYFIFVCAHAYYFYSEKTISSF